MAYSGSYHPMHPASEPEAQIPEAASQPPRGGRMLPDLGALLRKAEAAGPETDDLLMALILFLMYRESGDTDLLIMLGAFLLT